MPRSKGWTEPGRINEHEPEVIRKTNLPGTDHNQYIYVLRCGYCGHEYGVNGSDIHLRKCPSDSHPPHERGAPGLAYE